MKNMHSDNPIFRLTHLSMLLLIVTSCQSQPEKAIRENVGGPCEGCEAVFEYGNKELHNTDTLPDFQPTSPKLKLTGIIYQKDGKTPAEGVVLYIYHTNRQGIYATQGDEKGWARRHGYIRGWIKSGRDGTYTFYTFRPAPYPDGREPEHIHMIVKESNINEYYIDNIMFSDDPMLTNSEKEQLKNRAGSGIVNPQYEGGILTAKRDIILGLNIPGY